MEFRKDGTLVYATCEAERGRNVFQIGAAEAGAAVRGAEVVCVLRAPNTGLSRG